MKRFIISFLFIFMFLSTIISNATITDSYIENTSEYILSTVTSARIGSTAGEWAVIGMARSSVNTPDDYYSNYYSEVLEYLDSNNGVLHEYKYTEYSRVILALTAIGADPSDVGSYNLLSYLADFNKTVWQGMNGPIWALIALDSGDYEIPNITDVEVLATRQLYVDYILDNQLSDGGWSLTSTGSSDADITAMALQALSNYTDDENVNLAIYKALDYLSLVQNSDGGFTSYSSDSSEAVVQVIVALCALDISPYDEKFIKNSNSLVDNLLSFSLSDGSFSHTAALGTSNLMATEQSFYGLVALSRYFEGKSSLYNMDDVTISLSDSDDIVGLADKHEDVNKMPVINLDVNFPDTSDAAVLALASRGIITGKDDGYFYPDNTMTRAEFATIIVKSLGLTAESVEQFTDVLEVNWFAPYVGTAFGYGIVNGTSDTLFTPNSTITRQEAAVMVSRAAVLCGIDTEYSETATRNVLSQFTDYTTVSTWATSAMAFCYANDILDVSVMEIEPKEAVSRLEVAQMIYALLDKANLL